MFFRLDAPDLQAVRGELMQFSVGNILEFLLTKRRNESFIFFISFILFMILNDRLK